MVVTVFQLILIMTVLPLAALGDRIGHRRVYQSGLCLFMSATMLCLFARSLPQLLAVRALQGLGAAATFSVSAALIRSIYPRSLLGRGLALNTIVASTSASMAPTLGGLILSVASWPWLFAATIPIAAASLLAGRKSLPASPRTSQRYDLYGALLCAAMFGFGTGAIEGAVHGAPTILYTPTAFFAAILAAIFVHREIRKSDPILPVDLLGRKLVAWASSGALLANLAAMSLLLMLPFRLQQAYGYSPRETGLLLASWPVAMMIVAPAAGMLSDRIMPSWLCMTGMMIASLGMITLACLPAVSPGHFGLMWRIALTATGFGLYYSPNARQLIGSVPAKRAAAAGALSQTTRMAGQVLGSTIAAALLALHASTGPASPMLGAVFALAALGFSAATLKAVRTQPVEM